MAGAAGTKLGLQAVKRVLIRFCPFETNVEATRRWGPADPSRSPPHGAGDACSVRLPSPGQEPYLARREGLKPLASCEIWGWGGSGANKN
uniref:Uncharacterized protein n=1 Tax=Monodelphis domestica TaxID=13616 RepID=F7FL99_MONDO